jgi:hypothetical protein
VLAKASGAWLPRQWYRLGVRTSPGFVETFLDGVPVFRVRDESFGQGSIGLLAQRVASATFDDVKVRSYAYFRQDFSGDLGGAWSKVGGSWSAQNGVLNSQPGKGDGGKTRFLLAGRGNWSGYQMIASARSGEAGACGLVAGYRDDKNYTVFRWAGPKSSLPFRGRLQLMSYRAGKANIISDGPLKALATDKSGFARIRVQHEPGGLSVYSGDELIAQMADETLGAGKPALWSQGTHGSAFRDVVVFFPPDPEPPRVASRMEDDALMVGWASASGEWPPRRTNTGLEFWNTGEYFGDASLEFDWRRATYSRGRAELALRTKDNDFGAGYVLRVEGIEDRSGVRLSLLRDGNPLKQTQVNFLDIPAFKKGLEGVSSIPIRVALEGRGLQVSVGKLPVLSYLAPTPEALPSGTRLAARASGFTLTGRALRSTSSHRDDYTFSEAPTDWYAPAGRWNVISRWPCYSDWSFFGGQGLNPILWSKRVFSGDTVVEMYAHNQMDLPKELGYGKPGNLNISLGGDGKNPASGYSFIVAGWDNTRTRIYRGTRMVAESTSENARFERPINHNFSFHKRWFYIRAEARREVRNGQTGARIRLLMDDELLAEFFDANPLPSLARGGRVAFWTVDGTIMIARAKIESEKMGIKYVPADVVKFSTPAATPIAFEGLPAGALVPRPVVVDGIPGTFVEAIHSGTSDAGYRVRNAMPGGRFAVQLVKAGSRESALTVAPDSQLEFDMALAADARVDIYAVIDDVRHLITLTNGQRPDAAAPVLGAARRENLSPGESTSDGAWQRVSFNLGAALHKLYPQQRSWKLEALEIGALHGDEYRWAGFDGNSLGTSYYLRAPRIK